MRDLTEREKHADGRQLRERRLEIVAAGGDLPRLRFVGWREAFHSIEDDHALEPQAIRRIGAIFSGGETEPKQRLVEQLPRVIAGERATGAVRAVLARR